MSLMKRIELQYKLMGFFGNKTALVQKIEKVKNNPAENIDEVKKIITEYGLDVKSRKREIVYGRQLVMWYLYNNAGLTFHKVGKIFEKHHATVIHAVNVVNDFISFPDKNFKSTVYEIDTELRKIFYITPNI